ncbi:DUF222 domain-containing protein [Pseudonocardia sp.]|uniref:HNH endonuclease signature motif containing protein n=1 Tax=Pseudonocardia sp. TaxID=60912 RepID=UPI003D0FAE0D
MFESTIESVAGEWQSLPGTTLPADAWPDVPAMVPESWCTEGPRLDELPPSGFAVLELELATDAPAQLSDDDLVGAIAGFDKMASWAQARQARLLAELRRRRERELSGQNGRRVPFVPDEVGVSLRLSPGESAARVERSGYLDEVLPDVLEAWESGALDAGKVRIITDATEVLSPEHAAAVAARVLGRAPEQSKGQLRKSVQRAVISVDPEGAERRHQAARNDRRVTVNAQPEGMASLWAYFSAPDARACFESLTRLARGLGGDDPRRMDARRADLLVALLTGRISYVDPADPPGDAIREGCPGGAMWPGGPGSVDEAGAAQAGPAEAAGTADCAGVAGSVGGRRDSDRPPPSRKGASPPLAPQHTHRDPARPRRERLNPMSPGKPLITIVIPHSTLLDADDEPAELPGYGPIPAGLAREVAADGVWRRLVTDPLSGTVLDHGRTTYKPPTGLADHVRSRDLHCRGPRCPRPATSCELDHHVPHPEGPTSAANLVALCKRHHDLKGGADHGSNGWRVVLEPDGGLTWTTPTGRTWTSHPHDYRVDPVDLEHGLGPLPRDLALGSRTPGRTADPHVDLDDLPPF